MIYLDHAATTPLLPVAREALVDALGLVGNPSSIHSAGQESKRVLEEARAVVADSLGADPAELMFTSGGTESINLAIKGQWWARRRAGAGPRILVPQGEHHATIDAVEWLQRVEGAEVVWLPVDDSGRLRIDALEAALAQAADGASDSGSGAALVTLLHANNEVGTVQPVAEVVALAARFGVPVHLDAVGSYGQLPLDLHASGLAALSVSAHKIGGPLGIGALAVARSVTLDALIHGGNQQRLRSGTQDAPAAAGFAAAARGTVGAARAEHVAHLAALQSRLVAGLREAVPEAVLRGADPSSPARGESGADARLPGNVHATFPGAEGDSLLFLLDMAGFAVSTGSACQAGIPEVSHVLTAMGVPALEARGALRFTLGRDSKEADVDALLAALPAAYTQARRAGFNDREATRLRE